MTEMPNAQFEQKNQLEQQEHAELSEKQLLEQAYFDLDGFTDFADVTLPSLPDDLQAQLAAVMLANRQNPTKRDSLDEFE